MRKLFRGIFLLSFIVAVLALVFNRVVPGSHQGSNIADIVEIIISAIAIILLKPKDKEILNVLKGKKGEQALYKDIRKILPKSNIYTDLYIPKGNGQYNQVDLVAIDRSGVYVFECKNYKCNKIIGDVHWKKWKVYYKGKGYDIYNPIFQNKSHVESILKNVNIESQNLKNIVVFMGKSFKLKVEGKSKAAILREKELENYIKMNEKNILIEEEVQNISESFMKFTNASEEKRENHIKYVKNIK